SQRKHPEPAQQQARVARADAELPAAAAAVSQLLLGPVAGQLHGKRLLLVPDGALYYLPFAALPEPQQDGHSTVREPLIVAHELVSLPSASTLAVLRRELATRAPAPKALAVLADPVFARTDPRVKRHSS